MDECTFCDEPATTERTSPIGPIPVCAGHDRPRIKWLPINESLMHGKDCPCMTPGGQMPTPAF